jgi:ABC-type phosphate transport system permease subunit
MAAPVKNIFAKNNRGILLDVLVFVLQLILIRLLTRYFIELIQRASADEAFAKIALGLFFSGTFILPAAGAVLKRWHFHQRTRLRKQASAPLGDGLAGCLFHPIVYFVVSLCLSLTAGVILCERIFSEDFATHASIFLSLVFGVLSVSIVQTILVYRYFTPPKKAPAGAFRRDARSELLGDICIYLNMILFQILWGVLTAFPAARVSGFEDFAGRLFVLGFFALLLYFPPRIFYLADDIHRPAAWGTILLANAPTLLRILFGVDISFSR